MREPDIFDLADDSISIEEFSKNASVFAHMVAERYSEASLQSLIESTIGSTVFAARARVLMKRALRIKQKDARSAFLQSIQAHPAFGRF